MGKYISLKYKHASWYSFHCGKFSVRTTYDFSEDSGLGHIFNNMDKNLFPRVHSSFPHTYYIQPCVGMKSCSNSAYSSSFRSLFHSVNHWPWRWLHLSFRKHVSRSKEFSQWHHEHKLWMVATPKEAAGDPTSVVPKLLSFLSMLYRCICLKLQKIKLFF